MTSNKKKLDLKFGADIKELIVKPQAQQFKALDGNLYSFEDFTKNPTLTKLLTQGFQYVQSVNSNDRVKQKTNTSIQYGIRAFLAWIEEINYKDKLSTSLLLEFKQYLSTKNSSTAYSIYTVIARLTQALISRGVIDKFLIPKNLSLQQARNSSKAGATFATSFESKKINLSADDINEKVLSLIVDAAWEETFKLFKTLQVGEKLCCDLKDKDYIPYRKGMSRKEALEAMIKNLYVEFRGLSLNYSIMDKFNGYENEKFVKIIRTYINAGVRYNWGITAYEINRYFNPTKELVGNILILLCASHINPESANYLETGCLREDLNTDIIRISWVKNRAGGEQLSIPFPRGNHTNSKTIPNIIKLYEKATENLREKAPDSLKKLMFIWRNHAVGKKSSIQYCRASKHILIKQALSLIKKNLISKNINDSLCDFAIRTCDTLTLNLIRTTAINISSKRLNRDINNVAAMDGRKSENVLVEHYLNNRSTKEAFDLQIRDAQKLMYEWINSKPVIIPENEKEIVTKLQVSEQVAKQLIQDEFNNGYGASLIKDTVIIIDSALNALRIMQWLKKLENSEIKMRNTNPERWDNIFFPQKKLFNEALALMSKKSKSEAIMMDKEITLPFPEVA